jgi:N6-adenosine-specific RNA methylase IME4
MTNPNPIRPEPGRVPPAFYRGPRFDTIAADPPWGAEFHQTGALGASRHYDTMRLADIKAMPVAQIATENAHLWLWVTNASLRAGYDVAEAWGFTVRSVLTWTKPRFTLGNYLRNQTEHVLFATRGRAPVQFKGQGTWLLAPLQDHSHKPEEFFSVVERVSGPGAKLELFSRRRPPEVEGSPWSIWGSEVQSDISIPGYPVPSDFDDQAD